MRSMSKWVVGGLALAAVALLVTAQVVSQEKKPEKDKPAAKEPGKKADAAKEPSAPGMAEMEAMMAKCKEVNKIGPQHKELEKRVGKWNTVDRMFMDPNAPPMEGKGTAEITSIYGGRYTMSKYQGDAMGEPFEGTGIDGYDNIKKQYVCIWFDSMSTCIMMLTGTADATGKVITYTGKYDDPMSGQKDKPVKTVVKTLSDDKFVFEWYEAGPDGKEMKSMEIEYTRQK